MNSRERILAMTVAAAVLLVGGGFLVYQIFLGPLYAKDASISNTRVDIEKKRKELHQAQQDHIRLERLKQLSLPGDVNRATREYETFLRDILVKGGFDGNHVHITPRSTETRRAQLMGKKQPIYTPLLFAVDATGKLSSLIKALESFYRTGLLHSIKGITVDVPPVRDAEQRADELTIKLEVEALIVTGADNRGYLLPNIDRRLVAIDAVTALRGGPAGLAWATWALSPTGLSGPGVLATRERKYASIAGKNIFIGNPTEDRPEIIDTTKYVYLTHIVQGDRYHEAYFYDRFNARQRQVRNQPGLNQATISDTSGDSFITIKAVQIDPRDLIFSVGENHYSIHVGQNLEEAMKKPLSPEQVEALIKDRAAASTK